MTKNKTKTQTKKGSLFDDFDPGVSVQLIYIPEKKRWGGRYGEGDFVTSSDPMLVLARLAMQARIAKKK